MSDWHQMGLRALRERLDEGAISASELFAHFRRRAETFADLNAFLSLSDYSDSEPSSVGKTPLAGIPIAHKDIFCAEGEKTTCGSKILENFVSPYDSTVVRRFREAGMPTLGRTNMDEFAMGSSGEHSAKGATKNPWDPLRTPGGSSSGSAAAVAARLAPVATATDTGGSIRQPAAFCGVTGIKPTYGRVSRYGMVAFASSFDQGGVIAVSAEDCALALSAIAGFDEKDSTSLEKGPEDFAGVLTESLKGLRIGTDRLLFPSRDRTDETATVPAGYEDMLEHGAEPGICDQVEEAIGELQTMGATRVDIHLRQLLLAIPAYYVLTAAEASSNLSRYDGIRYGYRADGDDLTELYERSRSEGFGGEVKRRILTGAYVLSDGYYDAYYRRAMKIRKLIADDFAKAFEQCDVIITPTTPNIAFPLGAIKDDDPVSMYWQDLYTVPANLAGLPAMSVPCGFVDGMPVGLQLIGKPFSEPLLLRVAHQYQRQTDFHTQIPAACR